MSVKAKIKILRPFLLNGEKIFRLEPKRYKGSRDFVVLMAEKKENI